MLQRDSGILCLLTFLQAPNVRLGKDGRSLWGGHLAGRVPYAVAAGDRFDRRGYSETLRAWANSRHQMRSAARVRNDSALPWALVVPMKDATDTGSKKARVTTSLPSKCP